MLPKLIKLWEITGAGGHGGGAWGGVYGCGVGLHGTGTAHEDRRAGHRNRQGRSGIRVAQTVVAGLFNSWLDRLQRTGKNTRVGKRKKKQTDCV